MQGQLVRWHWYESITDLAERTGWECKGILIPQRTNLLIEFDKRRGPSAKYVLAEDVPIYDFVVEGEIEVPEIILSTALAWIAAKINFAACKDKFEELFAQTAERRASAS